MERFGNSNKHWINVTKSDGMFSTEYTIKLQLANGKSVSFFADKELVREENGKTWLKVVLVDRNPSQQQELVLLPTETIETASRWAEVPLR